MLIDICGLKLSLGGVVVLHDVKVSIDKGEIYGLLGPNGAGKSTTIAAALGLVKADARRLCVLGKDPRTEAHAMYEKLGVLPELHGFYDWMTAEDYLAFFAALYKRQPSQAELGERLARVGLEPRPGQPIGTFSRGMRQRLGLARALVAEPDLLILDEPTNGLDPRGRRELHDILLDLSRNHGVGVLLCTHLLDDVERLCTRLGVIVAGRTVAEGAIADLVRTHGQLARFRLRLGGPVPQLGMPEAVRVVAHQGEWCIVDLDPEIDPQTVWRALLFMGWPITEIGRESGGLEELYLKLTEGRAA